MVVHEDVGSTSFGPIVPVAVGTHHRIVAINRDGFTVIAATVKIVRQDGHQSLHDGRDQRITVIRDAVVVEIGISVVTDTVVVGIRPFSWIKWRPVVHICNAVTIIIIVTQIDDAIIVRILIKRRICQDLTGVQATIAIAVKR